VQVFRLVTEHTIEERILRRALSKLKLDALVIQSGGLVEGAQRASKSELVAAIRHGAEAIFQLRADQLGDDDIDAILEKAQRRTQELEAELQARAEGGVTDSGSSAADSRAWKFGGDSSDEEGGGSAGTIDIGKRERKQATKINLARPAPASARAATTAAPAQPTLLDRPAQTFPPYKDLVLLAMADPSCEAETTVQKLTMVVKRLWPELKWNKKRWAQAIAKALESGQLTKGKGAVSKELRKLGKLGGGGGRLAMTEEGKLELEVARETERKRRSREELDPNRAPEDAEDTPFPGWRVRTYHMADGGTVKHYVAPELSVAPEESPTDDIHADGGDKARSSEPPNKQDK
jgi:hypothetical protein